LSLQQLAHELNSKLDSSMRTLGLAERALSRCSIDAGSGLDDVAVNLRRARDCLVWMAQLLDRASSGRTTLEILSDGRPLGRCIDHVLMALGPLAAKHGVHLDTWVAAEAADLPGGPLASVIENAVRNAIESCAQIPGTLRRVGLQAQHIDGTLSLRIHDSGTGLQPDVNKPGGHGLGLAISSTIIAQLGGTLQLTDNPEGTGALLELSVPTAALTKQEAA
jgi:signal transduction histidine kinase